MNTIYQLARSWNSLLDDFATNDEELRWLAINDNRKYYGLKVRAEIDWEAETVTAIPLHDDYAETITYDIYKINRATQEDV
jgi:hypothetical protein